MIDEVGCESVCVCDGDGLQSAGSGGGNGNGESIESNADGNDDVQFAAAALVVSPAVFIRPGSGNGS